MSTQEMSAVTSQNPGPKALLKQLVSAASDARVFQNFLQTRFSEDIKGIVAPRYGLDKTETVKRLIEVFAFASGGTVTLVAVTEEGHSACARVVLTRKKHDLRITPKIDPRTEVVVEAAIWMNVDEQGQITHLSFLADMLTPGGAMGMQMVRPQTTAAEPQKA